MASPWRLGDAFQIGFLRCYDSFHEKKAVVLQAFYQDQIISQAVPSVLWTNHSPPAKLVEPVVSHLRAIVAPF